jgi:hypothetical protein
MTCDCENDEQGELFDQALETFLDEWRQNDKLKTRRMIWAMIREVKIDACFAHSCFYHVLGDLNYMLHDGLEDMFYDICTHKDKEEKENASSTL